MRDLITRRWLRLEEELLKVHWKDGHISGVLEVEENSCRRYAVRSSVKAQRRRWILLRDMYGYANVGKASAIFLNRRNESAHSKAHILLLTQQFDANVGLMGADVDGIMQKRMKVQLEDELLFQDNRDLKGRG